MDSKAIQFSILVVSGEGAVPFRCGRPLFCGVDDERLRLRLQGLTLPTIPAGEGRPPLHCTVGFGIGEWSCELNLILPQILGEFLFRSNGAGYDIPISGNNTYVIL